MKHVSDKRAGWLADYRKHRLSWMPTECARCGLRGAGWIDAGGNFEPHHPFRRRTRWAIMTYIPVCTECHRWIEDHGKQSRSDGWIIDYVTVNQPGGESP